jgi:hypothetical protein
MRIFIGYKNVGSLLAFEQVEQPRTTCSCCGQPIRNTSTVSLYIVDGLTYILASYGSFWHDFPSKEAALAWLSRVQPYYAHTKGPELDKFLVMDQDEYKVYITPTPQQIAQSTRYQRRECLRVWKLFGFAPEIPSTKEALLFGCNTIWEWKDFKKLFDRKYGKVTCES